MIGMFDSGIGGLSVLIELKKRAPDLDVVYWGDIKNVPYGTKKQEELQVLMANNIHELIKRGATHILNACNTMSTVMALGRAGLRENANVEIVEMVGPTIRALAQDKKQILILATPATIASEIYQKEFERVGVSVKTRVIPELALAIESGKDEKEQTRIIESALSQEIIQDVEVIALCCTHYPFAEHLFKKVLQDRNSPAKLFNPATVVAEEVIKRFGEKGEGKLQIFISRDSSVFRDIVAKNFTDSTYSISVT